MIKTVSFAPPRSARAAKAASKSASKPAPAQPARVATAAAPAAVQPARVSSGSSPTPLVEENNAAPRRGAAKPSTSNEAEFVEAKATKSAPIQAAEVAIIKTKSSEIKAPTSEAAVDEMPVDRIVVAAAIAESAKPVAPKKPRARKAESATPATSQGDLALDFETSAQDAEIADVESIETVEPTEVALAKSEPLVTPKIKRSRAPKDLALQYGAAPETEVAPRPVAEKTAPRKRLTREAKAARSQMLRPDDDVLQRLQQANAVEVKKPASRGRGWEFECGCCGRVTRFQTPAAICECGAIAVKE